MLYFVTFGFCSLCSYVGRAKDVVSKVMLQPVCHAGFLLGGHKMAEFGTTFRASLTLKELPGVKPKRKARRLFMMYIAGPKFVGGCASFRLLEDVK